MCEHIAHEYLFLWSSSDVSEYKNTYYMSWCLYIKNGADYGRVHIDDMRKEYGCSVALWKLPKNF